MTFRVLAAATALVLAGCGSPPDVPAPVQSIRGPWLMVLGIAQDGGAPQTGRWDHPGWTDSDARRHVASLGLVTASEMALFDATPDLPEQLWRLAKAGDRDRLTRVFLTHAHIGHYTGLMHLGRESMGARDVRVHATSRMAAFLEDNGPWSQLVHLGNIRLDTLLSDIAVDDVIVEAVFVPHRQEFADVVAFRIRGPNRSVLYLPDIDRWEDWDVDLEDAVRSVDVAFVDGTFYADGELPGRDMSEIPHPLVTTTMDRLQHLTDAERARVHFIHLNHTNPALDPDSEAARTILRRGFRVAWEGQVVGL